MPSYTAKLTSRLIAFTKQFPCSDLKMIEPWRSKCRFHYLDFLKNWRILCLNCVISHRASMATYPKTTAIPKKIWRTLLGVYSICEISVNNGKYLSALCSMFRIFCGFITIVHVKLVGFDSDSHYGGQMLFSSQSYTNQSERLNYSKSVWIYGIDWDWWCILNHSVQFKILTILIGYGFGLFQM